MKLLRLPLGRALHLRILTLQRLHCMVIRVVLPAALWLIVLMPAMVILQSILIFPALMDMTWGLMSIRSQGVPRLPGCTISIIHYYTSFHVWN